MTTLTPVLRIIWPAFCLLILYGCATVEAPEADISASSEVSEAVQAVELGPLESEPELAALEAPPIEMFPIGAYPIGMPHIEAHPIGAFPKEVLPIEVPPRLEAEILLSAEAPAYRSIANQLNVLFDKPVKVYTLTGVAQFDDDIIDQLRESSAGQTVAVGLRAAIVARDLDSKQVIFCQVFNHGDHDLISENMKGVGAMPAPRKLFKDWKQLSPHLRQVVVITGAGFNEFMASARQAAGENGIELVHQVVATDKEFLYAVKRFATPTQGHWLLPDNRVLSDKVLREVMAFNSKKAIQTVVFQPQLLSFGGLFYVMPNVQEISGKVITRLEASIPGSEITGDDILFLAGHEMGINSQVARQLDLEIPEKFGALIYDQ